jgi:hypothetical protein
MAEIKTKINSKATQLSFLDESNIYPVKRLRFGIILSLIGLLIFLVGAKPDILGLDRSPVIGFVQISVMLVGLAIICFGGYLTLISLWFKRTPSIAAEIGMRFIATGYVIAVISGMADIIGFGSHPFPFVVPYFGIWQARGVQIGEGIIAIGLLLMFPYSRSALFNGKHEVVTKTNKP